MDAGEIFAWMRIKTKRGLYLGADRQINGPVLREGRQATCPLLRPVSRLPAEYLRAGRQATGPVLRGGFEATAPLLRPGQQATGPVFRGPGLMATGAE